MFRRGSHTLVLGALCAALGCTSPEPSAGEGDGSALVTDAAGDRDRADVATEVVLVDAAGDTLRLPHPARRVLSLVPSATETLLRLGAGNVLVGRTDHDRAPEMQELPSVGGGLGPNLEILRTLDPEVVVAFAGESDRRTTEGLRALGIPVFQVRPDRLTDAITIAAQLAALTGREEAARSLIREMESELAAVREAVASLPAIPTVYLLGGSPPLAAGPGTFIIDLVELAGGRNVLDDLDALYAPVSPEVLRARAVEVVLMGEGSRVDPRILQGRRVQALPAWVEIPGPELGRAAWLVARALHPELAAPGGG